MQGSIAFDGTLSGSIAGGGGGGSEVTITPTLTEGEKIADYEIDGTPGELYAPTPTPLPDHIVTDIYGFSYTPYPSTEVARYTIDDGEEQSIRTPDYTTTWEAYPGVDQDYTIGILRCYGSNFNVKIPYYQKPLTAGANITIDADNVISASGGSSINYSTTEQDIGLTWIDGSRIYQRTFPFNISTVSDWTLFDNSVNYNLLLSAFGIITSINACYPFVSNFDDVPRWCVQNGVLKYYYNGSSREGYVTCLYTKSA